MHPLLKALIEFLLAEVKDAKTLLLRIIAVTFAIILYYVVTSGPVLVDVAKSMTYSSFLQEQKQIQADQFTTKALYATQSLYALSGADIVAVVEFRPENINERQIVIAQSGKKTLENTEFPVNKASTIYTQLLAAHGVLLTSESAKQQIWTSNSLYPPAKLEELGLTIVYLYPVFNLNSVLSSYLLIGWEKTPFDMTNQLDTMNTLRDFVVTQAIQLGRTK